ncbi:hypothetical protein FZI02_00140 [Cronobacter sakazakii]|nr:hypothetical protein [Cronobacter sakazakii]EGT5764325.1 hypothetical protein [Cronobacter sakazakii]EJG0740995.1 hypothetical protein [Cronobacter sakazakii]EJG0745156.1 hypothetical protein [Cronobacter sakazakii]ELY2534667.1 hypothetical protein [Cronobacter sakazakii]
MNYIDAALNDMNSYRTKRKQVREEVAKLEKQIELLKTTVIKPDMSEHIKICTAELKAKQDAFIPALKKAVMTDEFTRQWQMRALSAFNHSKSVQTPRDLFRIDGGAATMAYMLTGQLDDAVLRVVMPHSDIFKYVHVLTDMCKQLGILEEELEDIDLDMEFIETLKSFQEV